MFECTEARKVWDSIYMWINSKGYPELKLDYRTCILGHENRYMSINMIVLVTKYALYSNKNTGKKTTIQEIKARLKAIMIAEEYHAKIDNNIEKFMGKWAEFYNELKNLNS